MKITVDVSDAVLEKAIEAAAIAGIQADKIVEEALRAFVKAQAERPLVIHYQKDQV